MALLVSDARQRSRIANAQRELHSTIGSLRTASIMAATSPREERDLRKAYDLCAQAEELVGDLMTARADPCIVCQHEADEHDAETEEDGIPCKLCACKLFTYTEDADAAD